MTDNVFVQHGDYRDAANLAQGLGAAYRTSYIVEGLELTADLGELEVDVGAGVLVIWRGEMETADDRIDPAEARSATAFAVELEERTGIALIDDAVNHVFVDATIGISNSPSVEVNTSGDAPSDESVKIGDVDTNEADPDDAVADRWYLINEDATLTFPDSDALDEAAAELRGGTIVYDRDGNEHYTVT